MPTSLGPAEILVILVVALIVLGPKRLPEAGRQVGKAIAEVRRWTTDVTSEIKSAIDVEAPLKSTVVEPTVVSASPTAVDTDVAVPAAVVVDPVTVSGTETGVDTSGESPAADPDAPPAEPTVVAAADPDAPPAEPQAAESGSAQAVVVSEPPAAPADTVLDAGTPESLAVVPVGSQAVAPMSSQAVAPVGTVSLVPVEAGAEANAGFDDTAEIMPPVDAEVTAQFTPAVITPDAGEPTAEQPESPSGDPARP